MVRLGRVARGNVELFRSRRPSFGKATDADRRRAIHVSGLSFHAPNRKLRIPVLVDSAVTQTRFMHATVAREGGRRRLLGDVKEAICTDSNEYLVLGPHWMDCSVGRGEVVDAHGKRNGDRVKKVP